MNIRRISYYFILGNLYSSRNQTEWLAVKIDQQACSFNNINTQVFNLIKSLYCCISTRHSLLFSCQLIAILKNKVPQKKKKKLTAVGCQKLVLIAINLSYSCHLN